MGEHERLVREATHGHGHHGNRRVIQHIHSWEGETEESRSSFGNIVQPQFPSRGSNGNIVQPQFLSRGSNAREHCTTIVPRMVQASSHSEEQSTTNLSSLGLS